MGDWRWYITYKLSRVGTYLLARCLALRCGVHMNFNLAGASLIRGYALPRQDIFPKARAAGANGPFSPMDTITKNLKEPRFRGRGLTARSSQFSARYGARLVRLLRRSLVSLCHARRVMASNRWHEPPCYPLLLQPRLSNSPRISPGDLCNF